MKEGMMIIAGPSEKEENDELDCMLKHYMMAKEIESDPMKLQKLKEYAMSKNKMVEQIFKSAPTEKPKSFADLKKKKQELDKMEMEDEESED